MQYFHAYSIHKLNSWFCNLYCKLLCCFPHVSRRESRRESRQCVGSFKQKPLAKAMTSKRCSTGPSPLNRQNSGITEFTGVTQQTAALNNSAQRPEMAKNIESRCSMQSRNDIWSVLLRYITAGFVSNYPNKRSVRQGLISFHFYPSDRTNSESWAFFPWCSSTKFKISNLIY